MSNAVPMGNVNRRNKSARPVPPSSVTISCGVDPAPSVSHDVPVQSSSRTVSTARCSWKCVLGARSRTHTPRSTIVGSSFACRNFTWPNPSLPSGARRITSRLKLGLTASEARLAALRAVGAAECGSSTSGVRSHPANRTHAASGTTAETFMGASGGGRTKESLPASASRIGACVHAEIDLQTIIPGVVAQRAAGDPPRGSGHLSYSAIWVADGAPLELLASLIHGVPLPERRADQRADERAGGRCAERDDCRATSCVAASAIAAEGRRQAYARSQASREPDTRPHQGAGAARATPDLNACHVAQAYARPRRSSGQEAVTCHRRPEDDDLTRTAPHAHAVLRGDQALKLGEAQGVEFQPVPVPGVCATVAPGASNAVARSRMRWVRKGGVLVRDAPNVPESG